MGYILDKPVTDKVFEVGEGPDNKYVAACMQGWRRQMEDVHVVNTSLNEDSLKDWSYFAIFDGHGGDLAAEYSGEHLLQNILSPEFFKNVPLAIYNGFFKMDHEMRTVLQNQVSWFQGGTTALCAFISPEHIFIANCGDSRAVLSKDGTCIFGTIDHKPRRVSERQRIQAAGGYICFRGRVNRTLAVSRSLGDFGLKNVGNMAPHEQWVSAEPEIFVLERDGKEEFLLLACDGIWDVVKNEEICKFIRDWLAVTDDLKKIASHVMNYCLEKLSRDNMTLILIVFPKAPKTTPMTLQIDADEDGDFRNFLIDPCQGRDKIEKSNLSG